MIAIGSFLRSNLLSPSAKQAVYPKFLKTDRKEYRALPANAQCRTTDQTDQPSSVIFRATCYFRRRRTKGESSLRSGF